LFARRERRDPLILLEEQRAVDELDHERLAARADVSQTQSRRRALPATRT
jgi:hypothetical protein